MARFINRIRLEFKDPIAARVGDCTVRINRIRLEFKVVKSIFNLLLCSVLIESDWNLKWLPIVAEETRGNKY